ncbi:pentatricopeptide repeat-containing protein At5g65560-like [Dendrobium catenatum]|nr:pentatricopeptide repeat-containing protein At5g65560-like [Dendrobium catenatum]
MATGHFQRFRFDPGLTFASCNAKPCSRIRRSTQLAYTPSHTIYFVSDRPRLVFKPHVEIVRDDQRSTGPPTAGTDSASRFIGFFSTSASLASSPPPRGSADRLHLSMLQSCVSAADTRLALDAIMVSANSGRSSCPSLRCYNTLLLKLEKFGMVTEMKSVYCQMLLVGILPNLFTYNTMINSSCKLGDISNAMIYLGHLVRAGFDLDTFTFNSLMMGYCRRNDIDRDGMVYETMLRKSCKRDVHSYTILIDGLLKAFLVEEALKLLSEME